MFHHVTEQQANERWCPFGRAVVVNSFNGNATAPWNRFYDVGPSDRLSDYTRCVGSSCMAWRWGPLEDAKADDPDAVTAQEAHADPRYVDHMGKRRLKPRKGWCGLVSNLPGGEGSDG